ncbi:MAG: cephalosporin hydroxylase family protein [Gammaproteobacteria bacterium]
MANTTQNQDDTQGFLAQRKNNTESLANLETKTHMGTQFLIEACKHQYSYNFDWLGLPIIQFPQDMVAVQEIIWKTKPDLIIETGVARGGSLILSASILQLLNGDGRVIGIDIDIRPHNKKAIETHPLAHRIELIQGSSIDPAVLSKVGSFIQPKHKVMVILDSSHTKEHVLEELNLYENFVSPDCYLIVMDTVVDDMPEGAFPDRPWGKHSNPKQAVHEFLKTNTRFSIDKSIQNKLLITVAPDGYLKCLK